MTLRHTGIVSLAVLSFVAVIFAFACVIAPRWVNNVGLDVWNLPSHQKTLKEAVDRDAVLDEQHEQLAGELAFGDHLARRLIDGTITLAQATDQLEPIMRNRRGFDTTCELIYRVRTLRQGTARNLIVRIEALISMDSSWPAISARLEAEFAAIKEIEDREQRK
jgi:hypothetical protein